MSSGSGHPRPAGRIDRESVSLAAQPAAQPAAQQDGTVANTTSIGGTDRPMHDMDNLHEEQTGSSAGSESTGSFLTQWR